MPRSLNPQQLAFCTEYVKTGNASKSAVSAGYSAKTCAVIANQLMKKPLIVAQIGRLRAKVEKRAELTAQSVYDELAKLAFGNVQDLYDDLGNLKPINELPREVAAIISQVDGSKVKTHSKLEALSLASRLLGMVRDNQEARQAVQILIAPAPSIAAQPRVDVAQLKPEWDESR